MRVLVHALAVLCLFSGMVAPPAWSQENKRATPVNLWISQGHEGVAGATVHVPVVVGRVRRAHHLVAFDIEIHFDPATVTWTGLTQTGGALADWDQVFSNSPSAGRLLIAAADSAGTELETETDTVLFTLQFQVNAGAAAGACSALELTSVVLNDGTPTTRLYDGRLCTVAAVPPSADLALSMSAAPDVTDAGPVQLTLTVRNAGPDAATGVTVHAPLPAGLTYSGDNGGGSYAGDVWTVGSLAAGASASLIIDTAFDGTAPVTASAEIQTADQGDPDSTPDNDNGEEDDQAAATVRPPEADLALIARVDHSTPFAGTPMVFSFSLDNDGPDTATGIRVDAPLPAGLTLVSSSLDLLDTGGEKPTGKRAGTYSGGVWQPGDLGAYQRAVLTVEAVTQTPGAYAFTAEVTALDQHDPDAVPGNHQPGEDDQDTAGVTVRAAIGADIVIVPDDAPGEGFNDPTPVSPVGGNSGTTLGAQRLIAVQQAAAIWGAYLISDVPVTVRARFDDLACDRLGQTVPVTAGRVPASADPLTWYPLALANLLNGSDGNGADPEIDMVLNSSPDGGSCSLDPYYYGLDGQAGDATDLVTAALGELARGLGLTSLIHSTTGAKFAGTNDIFSTYLENADTATRWTAMSNAERLQSAALVNDLTWRGPLGEAAADDLLNGGIHPAGGIRLRAEQVAFSPYFQISFHALINPDQLPEQAYRGVNHAPLLALAVLNDLGWPRRDQADLSLTLSVDNQTAVPGEEVVFTVTVHNDGDSNGTGIVVRALLPAGLSYVGHTGAGSYAAADGTWTVGDLAVGGNAVLTLNALVEEQGGKTAAFEVSAADQGDPDSSPNNGLRHEDDMQALTIGAADLRLAMSLSDTTPDIGDTLNMVLTLANDGPDTAHEVVVRNLLAGGAPPMLEYLSDNGGGSYDPFSGAWTVGTLAVGASASLTLSVRVNSGATFTHTAEVLSVAEHDPDSTPDNGAAGEDDQASVTLTVATSDLRLTASVDNPRPLTGEQVSVTLRLYNDGPNGATGITTRITASTGLTLVGQSGDGAYSSGTWVLSSRGTSGYAQRVLVYRVDGEGSFTVTGEIITADQPDPDSEPGGGPATEDDTASVTVLTAVADLSLDLGTSNPTANQGQPISFTAVVHNSGPDDASGIAVSLPLPAGLTYSSHGGGTYHSGSGTWTVGDLAAGADATLTLTAVVAVPGTQTLSGEISAAAEHDPDSTPGNGDPTEDDAASVTVGEADLSVTVAVSDPEPLVGDEVDLTVMLADAGPDHATGVVVAAPLPAGLTLISAPAGYQAGTGRWTPGTVQAGQTATLTLTVRIAAAGTKTFAAEVLAADHFDPDSIPGNGVATEDDHDEVGFTPIAFQGTTFHIINADPAGVGFNDPTPVAPVGGNAGTTLGQQRLIALQHAADIWGAQLDSDVDVTIQAQFTSLRCGSGGTLLGFAGPTTVARDFPGAPKPGTWYSAALAHALSGTDLNGGSPEILVFMNADVDEGCTGRVWYYGLDQGADGDHFDAVSVMLHELAHGLSFYTMVDGSGRMFFDLPDVYLSFLEDHSTGKTFPQMSASERVTAQTDSGDLHWTGALTTAASSRLSAGVHAGGHVQMYAPETYAAGSSVFHFNSNLTPDNLMEPAYVGPIHDTSLAISAMADMGWPTEPASDLRVAQTADNLMPDLDDIVTFQIVVHNDGPAQNTGILLEHRLDPGLVRTGVTGTGYDAGTGRWTVGTLDPGEEATLTVQARVTAYDPATSTVELLHADRRDPDSTPGNNQPEEDDQAAVTVGAEPAGTADLSLTMTVDEPAPVVGDTLTFTLTLHNDGPDAAAGVVVRDVLPAGLQYVSASGDGTWQPTGGNWNAGSLAAGADAVLALTVRATAVGTLTNSAQVILAGQTDPDSTPANNDPGEDDQDAVTVTPVSAGLADLSLDLVASPATPDVGATTTLTLTLANAGPDTAEDCLVALTLPAGLTYVSHSGPGSYADGVWSLPALNSSAHAQLAVVVRVAAPGTWVVAAQVTGVVQEDPDSTPGNGAPGEDDRDTVNVVPLQADLSLNQTVDVASASVGDTVTFTLTLTNSGPDDADGVLVRHGLNSGLAYRDHGGDGSYNASTGIWTVGTVANGAVVSLQVDAEVVAATQTNSVAEITASLRHDPDSTPDNGVSGEDDRTNLALRVGSGASAVIVIAPGDGAGEGFNDATPTAPVGGNAGTTLGQQRLNAFQYAADIWAELLESDITIVVDARFDPLTCSAGSGVLGSAGPNAVMRDFAGAPLSDTWYPAALANAIAATDLNGGDAEIRARFNSSIDNNNNCLSGTNWYYGLDGNAGGNIDLVAVLLHEMAHGLGFASFADGQTGALFYNRLDAFSALLEDHSTGLGWGAMTNNQRYASARDTNDLHWSGSDLTHGAGVLVAGTGPGTHVQMFAPGAYQPGSSVSHFSTALAPDELMEPYYTGPNHDPGLATLLLADIGWLTGGERADLSLSMQVDDPFAGAGDTVAFTLTVSNSGPQTANGVQVTDLLPAGYTYLSHQPLEGDYVAATGVWTVGTVPAGESAGLIIEARVEASGDRRNSAEITASDQPDPDSTPGNGVAGEDDQASASVGSADLSLSAAADTTTPDEAGTVQLTLTLANAGPDAVTARVRALLPAGLTFLSASGTYTAADGIWTPGPLGSGAQTGITLTARVNSAATQSFHAEVWTADLPDPDSTPGNGAAGEDDAARITLTPVAAPKADLSLALTVDDATPALGETATVTATLTNAGPQATGNVAVAVTYDAALTLVSADADGSYDTATGLWTAGTLTAGQTVHLYLGLSPEAAGHAAVAAEVTSSDLYDPDSTPGNGAAGEDDQAGLVLVAHPPVTDKIIIANTDGPGEGFNDPTPVAPVPGNSGTTLGQQRLNAFQYAADIWGSLLDISVPVVIEARFDPLQCSAGGGILGSAGPKTVQRDFPNAPVANTWYHAALANNLAGTDINGSSAEIVATFNGSIDNNNNCLSGTSWYYGTDGNPGNNMDLVSVLLHEFAHGLGFSTFVQGTTGARFMDRDDVYMRLLEDHGLNQAWYQMSNGQRAASAVDGDLHWTGAQVVAGGSVLSAGRHASGHVEAFAPSPYQQGSSVSHFSTNLAPNELMEPYYTGPLHDPGLAVALMRDIGWGQGASADVSLGVVVDEAAPGFGDTVRFTLTVHNAGPDEAAQLVVKAPLPAGLTFAGQSGGYDDAAGLWTVGTLAADDDAVLTVDAQVATLNAVSFSAQVQSMRAVDPDSTPGNNNPAEDDQDAVAVVPDGASAADLSVSLGATPREPEVGGETTIYVGVHNDGPADASGITVRFTMDPGLTFLSSDGAYDPETGIWQVPDTASAALSLLAVTARSEAPGYHGFVAELMTADQVDPDSTPGNGAINEDDRRALTVRSPDEPAADLALTLTTGNAAPAVGEQVLLTLTVRNSGPETADDVAARLDLDPGLVPVADDGAGSYSDGIWQVGSLTSGTQAVLQVQVLVNAADLQTAEAEVVASSLPDPDSTPDNDAAAEDDQQTVSLRPRVGGGAIITILNADSPGEGFNDPTPVAAVGGNTGTTLGQQRLIAFQYAADIWAGYLSSDVEIVVRAQFNELSCTSSGAVLGSAGANSIFRNFTGAPRADTWYSAALANTLAGRDLNGTEPEIRATFNSLLDGACLGATGWYYGIDGNPGIHIDLVTVLVHEMAHGLGFQTFVNGTTGARFNGYDDTYMVNLEDHRVNQTWPQLSDAGRASSALASGNLHWIGPHVAQHSGTLTAGHNGAGHVEMYAPNPYQSGSSVSHFSTSLAPNAAMEPSYTGVNHDPFLSAQLLYDVGWPGPARADLRLDVTADQTGVPQGDPATFTVTVFNDGPSPATGVTVRVAQGDGLGYVSDNGGGSYADGLWDVGIVPVGAGVSLDITVETTAGGDQRLSAQVQGAEQEDPDSRPGNNRPEEDDQAAASVGTADLSLDVDVVELEAPQGSLVTWYLGLHNDGPHTAHAAAVAVTLPAGLSFVSTDGAYADGLWHPADLAAGTSAYLQIVTRIDAVAALTVAAEVVAAAEHDPDSTPDNGAAAEDDQASDSLQGTTAPIGTLTLDIDSVFSLDCPNMRVRLQVRADGNGVTGLAADDFTLAEDGTPVGFNSIVAGADGLYELTYVTASPDGAVHHLDVSVTVGTTRQFAQADAAVCHISGVIDLQNGVTVTPISGTRGSWYYYRLNVPPQQAVVAWTTQAGTGDVDLYIRKDAPPTLNQYDGRARKPGNNASWTITDPAPGDWYVGLLGVEDFHNTSLVGRFQPAQFDMALDAVRTDACPTLSVDVRVTREGVALPGLGAAHFELYEDDAPLFFQLDTVGNGVYRFTYTTPEPDGTRHDLTARLLYEDQDLRDTVTYRYCNAGGITDLSNWERVAPLAGGVGSMQLFRLTVPAGADFLDASLSGGSGDADLYLRHGAAPTRTTYDARSARNGNTENLHVAAPAAGDWYLGVDGYADFADLALLAGYGWNDPNLTLHEISVADCPDIVVTVEVDNGIGPVTGLGPADFDLSENNEPAFAPAALSETSPGVYQLAYTTAHNTGDPVFLLITADVGGLTGQVSGEYRNCARDGGLLQVRVNPAYQALPGQTFTIYLHIQDVDPAYAVTSFQARLGYDPGLLTYQGYSTQDTLIAGWGLFDDGDSAAGEVAFHAGAVSAPALASTQEDVLVGFTFQVAADAPAEVCSALTFTPAAFLFNNGYPEAETTDGRFCVAAGSCPRAPGDLNADGDDASGFDAFLILTLLEGGSTPYDPVPLCVADVNCSGDVALMDAVTILQRAVEYIDGYCTPESAGLNQAPTTLDIPAAQRTVALGEPFSLDVDLTALAGPVYGYRYRLVYDPDKLTLDPTPDTEGTLLDRWAAPTITVESDGMAVLQLSPTAPVTETGTLFRLTGHANPTSPGSTDLTFVDFSMAGDTEPMQTWTFPITLDGEPCFDPGIYGDALADWPFNRVTDILDILSCLNP